MVFNTLEAVSMVLFLFLLVVLQIGDEQAVRRAQHLVAAAGGDRRRPLGTGNARHSTRQGYVNFRNFTVSFCLSTLLPVVGLERVTFETN